MTSQPVTPIRACVVNGRGNSPSSVTPHPVVLERDVPRPIEFEDSTLVCGGFLKTPVRVEVERQGLNRFVLISKCDWVFRAAVGRSRSRTAVSAVRTFEKLRVAALAALEMERRRNEELEWLTLCWLFRGLPRRRHAHAHAPRGRGVAAPHWLLQW